MNIGLNLVRRVHSGDRNQYVSAKILQMGDLLSLNSLTREYKLTYNCVKGKCKAVPLQARNGSRKLRLSDFVTTAEDDGKFVSLTHRPHLPPRKYSWYSFLLEAESTPAP